MRIFPLLYRSSDFSFFHHSVLWGSKRNRSKWMSAHKMNWIMKLGRASLVPPHVTLTARQPITRPMKCTKPKWKPNAVFYFQMKLVVVFWIFTTILHIDVLFQIYSTRDHHSSVESRATEDSEDIGHIVGWYFSWVIDNTKGDWIAAIRSPVPWCRSLPIF